MDQSKWSVPRHRNSRMTKSECPLQRPRFKIEGVWMLGCYDVVFSVCSVYSAWLCQAQDSQRQLGFVRAWPKGTIWCFNRFGVLHALQKIAFKQKQQPDQLMIWVSWQNLWQWQLFFVHGSFFAVNTCFANERTFQFQSFGQPRLIIQWESRRTIRWWNGAHF